MTPLRAGLPPSRAASPIATFLVRIEPSQVASLGVTRPAATIPGSLAATSFCSLRRLATASAIAKPNTGIIHSR